MSPAAGKSSSTGLRRNEVLGLAWEDVDLEAGVIHVRCQWGPLDEEGHYGRVPVKTKAGVRDVPIPAPLADALAAHKVTQEAQGLGPLIFDRGDGKPIAPAELDHAWADIREKLKLPDEPAPA
ncbi:MAG: tyrosine-type recombinase/integrase [Limnochordaceae bacterium]|nr:tyrosine-type recombinase/integrase [Limnochordaceae bacterium]